MKNIFEIATSVSSPLALAGLIAAIMFYIIMQMVKQKRQNPLFVTISKYLFTLALVAIVLGFAGYLFVFAYTPSKEITIRGIVFLDGKECEGMKIDALEVRQTTRTDAYGAFSLTFEDKLKLDHYSLKFSDGDIKSGDTIAVIKNDSSFKHFYLQSNKLSTTIEVPKTNPADNNLHRPSKHIPVNTKPAEQSQIVVKSPAPPGSTFDDTPNFDSLYNVYSSDELKLSGYGKVAYEHEDMNTTIKFLERAHAVQSSKVWTSNIPYLIAAYWKTNRDQEAENAIKFMYKEASTGPGYLNSNTTIGFLIQNFGYIKNTLSQANQHKTDNIVDKLLEIKRQVP